MISVYDLPSYCSQLEVALSNNFLLMKKRVELRNRLRNCMSKTKRKTLLQKYHKIKSLSVGILYGRRTFPNESLTFIGRLIEDTEKQVNRLQSLRLVHRTPMSIGGRCDIQNRHRIGNSLLQSNNQQQLYNN